MLTICYNDNMKTVTDRLKEAVRDSGLSHRSLALQAGVNRLSIMRFMRGDTGLALDQLDRLCAFLGLELVHAETVAKGSK